ncbi:hypothetical protein HMPREF1247_0749 [Atopobium sp. BV3Ac4]|nr:hypothetical protein HMPREF1247_0749 [Atopobium sp. BV3Ac4]
MCACARRTLRRCAVGRSLTCGSLIGGSILTGMRCVMITRSCHVPSKRV